MQVFVMIPYKPQFDRVYEEAIKPAVEDAGLAATVARDEHYTGAIFERVQSLIREADLCLADVTGGNPNVMWEAAYGQALGKPVVFIAQGTTDDIPFNVRHNNCILYDQSLEGLANLKQNIAGTIRAVRKDQTSDLQLLREIVLPSTIKVASAPFVVATNPLSYREAYRVREGWKRPPTTFSDYVGIRGLMRAFGLILGMQTLPELINPDDFDDEARKRKTHLYLIGSSKANRWTGLVMEDFFRDRNPKWDFRPDPESKNIRNPRVIIRCNGQKYAPLDWEGTNRTMNDFGIVIRGPHPNHDKLMVMVLAGRSALGTEAAALAVTEPWCIRELKRELDHRKINPDDHRQAFLAIVSVECRGPEAELATAVETFRVRDTWRC